MVENSGRDRLSLGNLQSQTESGVRVPGPRDLIRRAWASNLLVFFAPEWLRTRHRVSLVWTAGLAYLCLVVLLTWQALRGQPVISPDARTLGALLALLVTAGTASLAVVMGGLQRTAVPRDTSKAKAQEARR